MRKILCSKGPILAKKALAIIPLTVFCSLQLKAAIHNIDLVDFNPTHVQSVISGAAEGDTINLPSTASLSGGMVVWPSSVSINKGVVIKGAGADLTVIGNSQVLINGTEQPIFAIGPASDVPITIKKIRFKQVLNGINCAISSGDHPVVFPTKVRITGCAFEGFNFAIMCRSMFGVVDRCDFINNRTASRVRGYDTTDFGQPGQTIPSPPWEWDSTYAWCYENCHFSIDTSVDYSYFADTEYPASYVFRYCMFEINRNDRQAYDGFDMHGNGITDKVNPVGVQIYGNGFTYSYNSPNSTTFKLADIRGGRGSLVYDNNVYVPNDNLQLVNYVRADPEFSTLPEETYLWNNSWGSPFVNDSIGVEAYEGAVIDVNFFTHEPLTLKQLTYPHPLVIGPAPADGDWQFGYDGNPSYPSYGDFLFIGWFTGQTWWSTHDELPGPRLEIRIRVNEGDWLGSWNNPMYSDIVGGDYGWPGDVVEGQARYVDLQDLPNDLIPVPLSDWSDSKSFTIPFN